MTPKNLAEFRCMALKQIEAGKVPMPKEVALEALDDVLVVCVEGYITGKEPTVSQKAIAQMFIQLIEAA